MPGMDVLLFTFMPIFGCLLVLVLSLSPVRALLECEKNNSLGGFNPLPPCLFFLTNLVWVINGIFFKDVFVFFINVVMVSVNFQITIRAYRLASDEQKREVETVLHAYLWVAMLFGFGFLYASDMDAMIAAYGWMCCAFNMTVFIPPIFVMKRVFESRDSSSISAPFAIVGCFCTFFWAFYGILINQYSIVWPNVFGFVLSMVQAIVTFAYPGPKTSSADGYVPAIVIGATGRGGALTPSTSSKALLTAVGGSPSLVADVETQGLGIGTSVSSAGGAAVDASGTLVKRAVFNIDDDAPVGIQA